MTARDSEELECARQLVAARRQQRQSEWRARREHERTQLLLQTRDMDTSSGGCTREQGRAPRASHLCAQELALVKAVTQRQGFLEAQMATSHELSPLARWNTQLQLLLLRSARQHARESTDDDGVESGDSTAQHADSLAALEQSLARDLQCLDLVYLTGPSAQGAAEVLLEHVRDHDPTLAVDELLSFASMRNGVVIRATCAKQRGASYSFRSSLFVRDLAERATELLLDDMSSVEALIELLWSK